MAPTAGGRKQPMKTARGRPLAQQAHAVGGPAKKSKARTPPRTGWLVSGHLPGQWPAGLSSRTVQSRCLVSTKSSERSVRATHAHSLLRREGWLVNRKRVRQLYQLEGLQFRMRVRRRRHIALHRGPAPIPTGQTKRWSMDFVHAPLADRRPFRILTVVDNWSRHSPVLEAGVRMSGRQ